ncbi:MAG: chromate transporter [Acholeplasmataceae bacterium]|nr:chromate transporter [Acidaminococcaceae bacterium]NLY84257.1 chromate transporter [Acholeplasmataceae bacterium]
MNNKYLHMFFVFFKIGLFTIGGGLAMIPIIRHEFVERQQWISDDDIADVLALSQSMPGVIAVNASSFLGYRLAGVTGAVISTLGVVMPSFLIILGVAAFFTDVVAENLYLRKAFSGINTALAALIFAAALKLWHHAVRDRLGILLALASFLAIAVLSLDIALVVSAAAATGYLVYSRSGGGRR